MRKLAPDESVLSHAELAQQRLDQMHLAASADPGAGGGSSLGGDDEAESVYEEALETEPAPVAAPPQLKKRRTGSSKHTAQVAQAGAKAGAGAGALYSPEGVRAAAVKLRQLKEAMSM